MTPSAIVQRGTRIAARRKSPTPAALAYAAALKSTKKGGGRYRVGPVEDRTVNGHVFDSVAEARYYRDLLICQKLGEIGEIRLQPSWPLVVNGVKVGAYSADFEVEIFPSGDWQIVEVKSVATAKATDYRLRRKLFEAVHGRQIVEVVL